MSRIRRPTRLGRVLLSIATLLALQCRGPSGPGIARVDLTVNLAADPTGERLTATVEAHNRGGAVWYLRRCCLPSFDAPLRAPDGVEYWVHDPRPHCRCADFVQRIERNEVYSERIDFVGTLFDASGNPRPAPAGHYVWRFALRHCETDALSPTNCEQAMTSVEFNWPPPPR